MGIWSSIGTALFEAAAFVSPAWARSRHALLVEREQSAKTLEVYNRMMDQLSDHFGGVDASNRQRGEMWLRSNLSTNTALEQELVDLRKNADELYRTFPHLTGAINHRVSNVIGRGLMPKSQIGEVPGTNENQRTQWEGEINALFRRWAPRCGPRGRTSWTQTLRIALTEWKRSGDSFIVWSHVPRDGKPIPLQLDVMSARRCDSPHGGPHNPLLRMGVEFDADGDINKYHFRNVEPGDTWDSYQWSDFPADRVGHLLDELWPEQIRGLPWCFSTASDAKDLLTWRRAAMFAAQIHACQTLIVKTRNPAAMKKATLNSAGEVQLTPGNALYFTHEDEISAFNPSQPTTSFSQFSETQLMSIACGLGYPVGWFTRDRRKASFSSGKLEEIDGALQLLADFQILNERAIAPSWEQFVDMAVLSGQVSIPAQLYVQYRHLFQMYLLTPPGRQYIEPLKEVIAAILAKEHNISTLAEIHHRLGSDTGEVLRQRVRETMMEVVGDIVPPTYTGTPAADESQKSAAKEEDS